MSDRWLIPDSWEWVVIEQLGRVIAGGTPKASDPSNFQLDGIPWITPADLTGYKSPTIRRGRRCLSEKGLATSSAVLLPKNTVLFSSRAPIGYCVVADNEIATNQGFKNVVIYNGVNPFFIRHYLLDSKSYAEQEASGTTFLELSASKMKQLKAPLPPLNEQNRIVDKIEALQAHSDAAQASLDAIPPLLEKLRQSVLAAAFRGDLTRAWREQNPDVEPASVLLERIRAERKSRFIEDEAEQARAQAEAKAIKAGKPWGAEEDERALAKARVKAEAKYVEPEPVDAEGLPELPEGWCWARAEEVCEWITKGTTPPKSKMALRGERPFIKVYNLTFTTELDFTIDPTFISDETHQQHLARSRCYPGDVLMNIVGPPLGKVSVVPKTHDEWNINQAIAVFRPISGMDRQYLAYHLLREWTVSRAKLQSKATAGQFNLTLAICRDLPVPLCSLTEQQEALRGVIDRLECMTGLLTMIEQSKETAASLNQSILAKAFRGELVPQDPTDEPASVLLERIRQERAEAEAAKKGRKGKRAKASSTGTWRGRPRKKPGAEDATVKAVAEAPSRVVNDTSRGEQMDLFEGDN